VHSSWLKVHEGLAMSDPRCSVLVFRELPPDQLARLTAVHQVVVANPRDTAQRAAFDAALPHAQGMIGSSVPMTEAMLDDAPHLRVISSISVGVDNYPVDSLRRRGIALCHTPGVLTETTADTVFSLLMCTSRRVVELANRVREGRWDRNIGEELYGWDVHGKTLGILGFGRIGQAVARRGALGFGMPVVYAGRRSVAVPELAGRARHVSQHELLETSDFVVATLPLNDETRGLMGPAEFAAMKPGAIFINGGRGATVQEAALLHALDHGELRAAGLDVFAKEPLPLDIGSATHETRHAMAAMATTNLLEALAGRTPLAVYEGG
jgi:phosphogluconate 2-dehydrogenase